MDTNALTDSVENRPDLTGLVAQIEDGVRSGKTPGQVREQLSPYISVKVLDRAVAQYEEMVGRIRSLREPRALVGRNLTDWYPGPSENDTFWPALRDFLLNEKGWSDEVVQSVDEASSKVVSCLQPPGLGHIETRGLVLGYVQSGKTANFTAVIAKAADIGYRMFIVLSGLHKALRRQTQRRLEQELVHLNPEHWFTLTSIENDFKELGGVNADSILTDKAHQKLLGVVKKNHVRLDNLLRWLRSANSSILANCPVLLIDDEADQASINAAYDQDDRTRINQQVIDILEELQKSAYVGYTATPFANVLVDPRYPEDLYPRDFIIDLETPADYFGTSRVFGRDPLVYQEDDDGADGLDMIRIVPEVEVSLVRPEPRFKDDFKPAMASSLECALQYFLMATAARRARGQDNAHSTMLIHTSLYIIVHNHLAGMIEDYREGLLARLRSNDERLLKELGQIWTLESGRVASEAATPTVTFEELRLHLVDVVESARVVTENSQSEERLEYGSGASTQIVIGGNTLSRGLTLEGLVVSYFVRAASAYDTLLQMGRWFGYREGYEDLPRIWVTDELNQHFRDLARVEHEIRKDIERYENEDLTPLDLAPRIRTHPTLLVTRKMGAAVSSDTSYSGTNPQTFRFKHRDEGWLKNNLGAAQQLLAAVRSSATSGHVVIDQRHQMWKDVAPGPILQFIDAYTFHPSHEHLRKDALRGYIETQVEHDGLTNWSVCVVGRYKRSDVRCVDLGTDIEFPLLRRSKLKNASSDDADVGAIKSPEDNELDLPILPEEPDVRPPGNGLLLLYPIERESPPSRSPSMTRDPLNAAEDVIGVAFSFPEAAFETAAYVDVQRHLWDQDNLEYSEEEAEA
ncbi:MAG: Z1 domain-containing protein [Actinomycetota bacterium]